MRVLVVLLILGVSIALFASTAIAFSMPFKMQMPGHSSGLSSLGSKTTGLKMPSSSSFFKQLSIPHFSVGKNAMMNGFGHSVGQGFSNPFGKMGIGFSLGRGINNPLSSKSRGLASLFAGFPILRK